MSDANNERDSDNTELDKLYSKKDMCLIMEKGIAIVDFLIYHYSGKDPEKVRKLCDAREALVNLHDKLIGCTAWIPREPGVCNKPGSK